jgi:hypothetical protein
MKTSLITLSAFVLAIAAQSGCASGSATSGPASAPAATASSAFWKSWGDGNAELSGYAATVGRYGAPRKGTIVLIYVTEPMDRRVWIKDDAGDVPAADRVNVLKLNDVLKFQTGIYPYSVMTSVFAPVDGLYAERFAPAKISFTSQEWCGQVWRRLLASPASYTDELRSYFHAEGEGYLTVATKPGTLYEDALLIQLRELDGPFAGGKDWSGEIVPALWSSRKAHVPARPVPATIRREDARRDGRPVTRFTLAYSGMTRVFDVEKVAPHRILGWTTSDGDDVRLLKTARLPYWKLHDPGGERYLADIGL